MRDFFRQFSHRTEAFSYSTDMRLIKYFAQIQKTVIARDAVVHRVSHFKWTNTATQRSKIHSRSRCANTGCPGKAAQLNGCWDTISQEVINGAIDQWAKWLLLVVRSRWPPIGQLYVNVTSTCLNFISITFWLEKLPIMTFFWSSTLTSC